MELSPDFLADKHLLKTTHESFNSANVDNDELVKTISINGYKYTMELIQSLVSGSRTIEEVERRVKEYVEYGMKKIEIIQNL